MSSILHRDPSNTLPLAVDGEGVWLVDSEGRKYLDASGGAAVSVLGHGHRRIVEAIREQAMNLAYAHTAFFTNRPSEDLADFLIARAPAGFGRVFFTSGGSEATESALKLARQYHVARGDADRSIFISRHQSYHGATLGALAVSGNMGRRSPYEAVLAPCRFIEPCYSYRRQNAGESLEDYGQRAAGALEAEILAAGPGKVAAFIAEPVVGATLGAVPAAPGYLSSVREICTRYGVLLIADEVMCGMGRTGTLFACEQDGVSPDLITVAKGLAGGYQPVGALLVSNEVADGLVAGAGRFEHGHTYIGHAIACAAALAVQETIEEEGLLERVKNSGEVLQSILARDLASLGVAGDIRGRGLLVGVELVSNPETKEPFPAAMRLNARIKHAAMEEGLIVYPGGGCVDGVSGDHILFAPPFIASNEELEEIGRRTMRAVERALERVVAA